MWIYSVPWNCFLLDFEFYWMLNDWLFQSVVPEEMRLETKEELQSDIQNSIADRRTMIEQNQLNWEKKLDKKVSSFWLVAHCRKSKLVSHWNFLECIWCWSCGVKFNGVSWTNLHLKSFKTCKAMKAKIFNGSLRIHDYSCLNFVL